MANGLKEGCSAFGCDSKSKYMWIGALLRLYGTHTFILYSLIISPWSNLCHRLPIRNQLSLHQLCPCLCSQRASSCFPQRAVGEWNWSDWCYVIAFFKELKIPADISAYKADVPKALQRIQSGEVGPPFCSLSLSLIFLFYPQLCRCVSEKEKEPLLSLETPLAIMERRAFL